MWSSFKNSKNKIFTYFFLFCTHSITVLVYDQKAPIVFYRNFSWQLYISCFQSFCQKSAERNRRRNTFRILFWCLAWGSNPGFSSNRPTHYLLDHGGYQRNIFIFSFWCLTWSLKSGLTSNKLIHCLLDFTSNKPTHVPTKLRQAQKRQNDDESPNLAAMSKRLVSLIMVLGIYYHRFLIVILAQRTK